MKDGKCLFITTRFLRSYACGRRQEKRLSIAWSNASTPEFKLPCRPRRKNSLKKSSLSFSAAWRRKLDTPREWAERTALAETIVGAFERTRRRAPGVVGLVHLRPRTVR